MTTLFYFMNTQQPLMDVWPSLLFVFIFPTHLLDLAKHCIGDPDYHASHVLLIGRQLDNGIIEDGEQQQIEDQVYFAPDIPGAG